ncbi:MAG TPA: GNAT family N-acetyltransferase [Bacteroidia bacterium]|jgi:predicted GNAT family N-acyltransferase|nr:GNAT family N-acetyltransferase [Bacteroidia bacterium]
MQHITYHQATQNDVQTLIDLRIAFSIELMGPQTQAHIDELKTHLKKYFTQALNHTCFAYLAKHNNQVVGVGELIMRTQPGNFKNPIGIVGYLMNMYTLPNFRKQGICAQILQTLINDAQKQGITTFELHATQQGENVYIQNGFKKHSEPTYRKYIS